MVRSKIYRYNANRFNVVSTQPVGRKSLFTIIKLLNSILSSKYRNTFLQGLINANKIEHLRILENIVHMYWNYYCIKNTFNTNDTKLPPYIKKSRLEHKTIANTKNIYSYLETDETTSDIVNFIKYGYWYPPKNTEFYFKTVLPYEGLIGIFELNEDNSSDLINLDNKIASIQTTDHKLKMGLKLNEVYEFRGDVPPRASEILKYNKSLKPSNTQMNTYTLEEIIAHIYLEGDIKPDEQVVIFDNSCRGISPKKTTGTTTLKKNFGNTISQLPNISKLKLNYLRASSLENSLEQTQKLGGKKSKKQKK